jgi:hypothetical protein
VRRIPIDNHGLPIGSDPSGNALTDLQVEAIDYIGMRVLRGPQHQFVLFKDVDKAGIALNHRGGELHNPLQQRMQWIGSGHAAANFVEKVDLAEIA